MADSADAIALPPAPSYTPSSCCKARLLKIIVLGDTNTGKTSLLTRYVRDEWTRHYKATIGADFLSKQLLVDGCTTTLQIWDTAGQERFQGLGAAFYRGAHCCILCYDLSDPNSWSSLDKWRDEFLDKNRVALPSAFPFVVVANKIDKLDPDKLNEAEMAGAAWCKKLNIQHYIASAKESKGVNEIFNDIAKADIARMRKQEMFVFGEPPKQEQRPTKVEAIKMDDDDGWGCCG
eukprot:gnl/Hemi2/13249_TR4538_c0_g1_i1.p1 gnl/Hemi2/13249_TR4538_c0_g1~~gnl/Hemi2/13249_TR4538_c0_g1_i1.p1  ORF type:complete len:234 (-),score=87.68 gnl/Hemi2/13249_TR4538_c0_g1_i1:245-946(-)